MTCSRDDDVPSYGGRVWCAPFIEAGIDVVGEGDIKR